MSDKRQDDYKALVDELRQSMLGDAVLPHQRPYYLLWRMYHVADVVYALIQLMVEEIERLEPGTSANIIDIKRRRDALHLIINRGAPPHGPTNDTTGK